MHGGYNYGGNVESTPPVPGAPFGKIILGNHRFEYEDDDGEILTQELMDPDLLRVFAKQKKQPIVEINTGWLSVGHVDEMMSVVPHGNARSGFSILHASSDVAMRILILAEEKFNLGLPMAHPMRGFNVGASNMPRLTDDSTSPITRMLRGKAWKHVHRNSSYGGLSPLVHPPNIYMKMALEFGDPSNPGAFQNLNGIGFVPGIGSDRHYPSDLTVREFLWAERDRQNKSCNTYYDEAFLKPSRDKIESSFPDTSVIPVPVLFDRVNSILEFDED
jgi:hypothetical protein